MDQWNKPLLGSRIDPEHPLSTGLVGCWLMNENSGDRIYDLSGNRNDGIFRAVDEPRWVPGKGGQALNFDGANDYVDCGDGSSLNPDVMSIETWIYPTGKVGYNTIVSRWDLLEFAYFFAFDDNTANLRLWLNDVANNEMVDDELALDIWHHVVAVHNGLTVIFYVNGLVVPSTTAGVIPATITSINKKTSIGYDIERSNYPFDGLIDIVRIWNRALSAQEVWDLYVNPYGMIWVPKVYYIPAGAVRKFTAENVDTHFIAENVDTHFIAEAL